MGQPALRDGDATNKSRRCLLYELAVPWRHWRPRQATIADLPVPLPTMQTFDSYIMGASPIYVVKIFFSTNMNPEKWINFESRIITQKILSYSILIKTWCTKHSSIKALNYLFNIKNTSSHVYFQQRSMWIIMNRTLHHGFRKCIDAGSSDVETASSHHYVMRSLIHALQTVIYTFSSNKSTSDILEISA